MSPAALPVVELKYPRELNDELRDILGRPNFMCVHIARRLRELGHDIPSKAEREQAAVIHWMLTLYLEHGDKWREIGEAMLSACNPNGKASE